MAELYETMEEEEKLLLVGVALGNEEETVKSLEELEELVDTYNKHYAEVVTPQNLLKLVSNTVELSSQVLKEIPEAVIYLTDEEPGWTLRGVLREYYDSIYGSEVCDKPSDRTPADYLEETHSSAQSDRSIADYYEKIGKCDF